MAEPFYSHDGITLYHGDCREVVQSLAGITAVVTDPPYGLEFMGKEWDHGVPGVPFWEAVLRVSKPGAHLLAFGGTRTFHRLTCAIEDAGWEIRDCIMWVYGSGFPKSLDISKAIDKRPKASSRLEEFAALLKRRREELGITLGSADLEITGGTTMYAFLEGRKVNGVRSVYPPNMKYYDSICDLYGIEGWDDIVDNNLEITGESEGNYGYQKNGERWDKPTNETTVTTEAAKQWDGWGTALKPAWEPIIVARKPIEGTVAQNVAKWGCGALNIGACRVGMQGNDFKGKGGGGVHGIGEKNCEGIYDGGNTRADIDHSTGRWPANLCISYPADETDPDGTPLPNPVKEEVLKGFPESKSTIYDNSKGNTTGFHDSLGRPLLKERTDVGGYSDNGSSARFFKHCPYTEADYEAALRYIYCPKESDREIQPAEDFPLFGEKHEAVKNTHPTVKPLELMKYLVTLVSMPQNNLILDPFAGSGTTLLACKMLGIPCIGIEVNDEYCEIAAKRLGHQ